MLIDTQTQNELNLWEGDNTLLQFLDRCTLAQSRVWLKGFFQRPLKDAASIREMQSVFQHLAHLKGLPKIYLQPKKIGHLRHYMECAITPSPHPKGLGNWSDSFKKIFIYRHYDELESLFKDTVDYLHTVQEFYAELRDSQPPEHLQNLLQPAWAFFQIEAVQQMLRQKRFFITQVIYFDALLREKYFPAFKALLNLLYKLEALFSLSQRVEELGWNYPELLQATTPQLELTGVYHPFLKRPIANPLQFESNQRLLFLTGPNMAGKTTYLKACALAVYLAHLGLPVPAQSMRLTPFETLMTSIEVSDNLSEGYSYFFSEVQRVKQAAQQLQNTTRVLLVFDELFRGTNVKDAYDCSLAVLERMAPWQNGLFLVSSHLTEVGESLKQLPEVQFACFEGEVQGGAYHFPYRLQAGLSSQRLGYQILKQEGVPALLTPSERQANHDLLFTPGT